MTYSFEEIKSYLDECIRVSGDDQERDMLEYILEIVWRDNDMRDS